MRQLHNTKLVGNAKALRKAMTKEERHLWYDFLKCLPQHFCRQKVIGHYILDFYCASKNIAIELDGSQHYEQTGKEKDIIRDNFLKEHGITVLRYGNDDICKRFENVCQDIWNCLQ